MLTHFTTSPQKPSHDHPSRHRSSSYCIPPFLGFAEASKNIRKYQHPPVGVPTLVVFMYLRACVKHPWHARTSNSKAKNRPNITQKTPEEPKKNSQSYTTKPTTKTLAKTRSSQKKKSRPFSKAPTQEKCPKTSPTKQSQSFASPVWHVSSKHHSRHALVFPTSDSRTTPPGSRAPDVFKRAGFRRLWLLSGNT